MATAKKSAAGKAPVKKPAAKAAAKPAVKKASAATRAAPVAVKPAAPAPAPAKAAPARPAAAAPVPKVAKPPKAKKPKQVRDSFIMPKTEYAVLDTLKLRASKLASPVKKSELLRAGVKALSAMPDADFLAAVKAVPTIKTGRPSGKN